MVATDEAADVLTSTQSRRTRSSAVHWVFRYLLRAGRDGGPTTLALAIIVGVWALLTETGAIKSYVLPTPPAVVSAFDHNYELLAKASWATAQEALWGFLLGNGIAVVMAIGFVYVSTFERAWYPLVVISQGIPMVALIPVFILMFGLGSEPKIAVAAFACIAPTLLNVRRGLRSADAEVSELFYTLSATGLQRLVKVRIPSALPYLFASFQVTVGRALISAMVAEWVSSNAGIGWLIQVYGEQFEVPQLWAAVVAATALCLIAFGIVRVIEHYATRWRRIGISAVAI